MYYTRRPMTKYRIRVICIPLHNTYISGWIALKKFRYNSTNMKPSSTIWLPSKSSFCGVYATLCLVYHPRYQFSLRQTKNKKWGMVTFPLALYHENIKYTLNTLEKREFIYLHCAKASRAPIPPPPRILPPPWLQPLLVATSSTLVRPMHRICYYRQRRVSKTIPLFLAHAH